MAQPESVAFDRAVDYYDDTRALPDATRERLLELLAAELQGRQALEVGVGTGRWAIPLAERGVAIMGLDLSLPMLRRLKAKPGGDRVPVAQGDATRLPFAEGAFDAVVLCHVLHLVPDWQGAVAEMLRVLRRPGVVLADMGGSRALDALMAGSLGAEFDPGSYHPGLDDPAPLDELMRRNGAELRLLPAVAHRVERPLRNALERLRDNQWSWTWSLSDAQREAAAAKFEAWAEERFGGVDAIPAVDHEIVWRAYDFSA